MARNSIGSGWGIPRWWGYGIIGFERKGMAMRITMFVWVYVPERESRWHLHRIHKCKCSRLPCLPSFESWCITPALCLRSSISSGQKLKAINSRMIKTIKILLLVLWIQIRLFATTTAKSNNGRIVTRFSSFSFFSIRLPHFTSCCFHLSFLNMMKNQRSSLRASIWRRHAKKSSFDRHRACLPPTGLDSSKPVASSNSDERNHHHQQHNNDTDVIPIVLVKCKQELLTRGKHSTWYNKSIQFDNMVAEHKPFFFLCARIACGRDISSIRILHNDWTPIKRV